MHVSSKKIAFLGILLAITVLLVYAGTIIESNTLFFLCAASFTMGIVKQECGIRLGVGYLVACSLLNLILVPQKMYCLTLVAMDLYILITEYLVNRLPKIFPYVKFVLFNGIFIPALIGVPELIYAGKMNIMIQLVLWSVGQVAFIIYDYVYHYVMNCFWPDFRNRIHLEL